MKTFNSTICFAIIVSVFLASGLLCPQVYGQSPRNIPESKIEELQQEFLTLEDTDSTIQKRRVCKKVARNASSLLRRYSDSTNRFKVLKIVFETQKALLIIQDSERNRDELIKTCSKLMDAPDEFADMRVEADMLLMQIELSAKESSPEDTALAIARFADRYRNTPAEARSLMMASTVAFDLGNRILLKAFRKTLSKRFVHDPMVNAFMRERFASSSEVHLRGEFKRADGKHISFPIGQPYLICFWSQDAPLLKDKIAEVKALQDRYKGQFEVFSFNLDELRDGAAGILKRMKLDWTPMLLPGGTENPTYLSVGGANLFSVLVIEPHGLAGINATGRHQSSLHKRYEAVVRSSKHMAILRSLSIGDFLVIDAPAPDKTTIPQKTLDKIQACFTVPPIRYRLTPDEALKNYEKAETLCADAVKKHSDAPDLWIVHNRRIIALLGMWRLSGDSRHLNRAVASAKTALAMDLPTGSKTIPQFCITTKTLRNEDADTADVLTAFIDAAGGSDAPGSAYAAAFMLSLQAHSFDQYIKYRDILLSKCANDPSTWPVASFLLERSSSASLFDRALPGRGVNLTAPPESGRLFKASFTTLQGEKVQFPGKADGKMLAIAFMETPSGKKMEKLQKDVLDFMARTVSRRPEKDIEMIGVFRSDDPNSVVKTMTTNKWKFNAACISDNDWSSLCRQYGIVDADRVPNILLVRPDGSIMFAMSGISAEAQWHHTMARRIEVALRTFDLAMADKALAQQNYKEYAARLSTSFTPPNYRRGSWEPKWDSPSVHGRKLVWAYMQANDFKSALKAANDQIAALSPKHPPRENPNIKWCRTCYRYKL